MYRVFPSLIPRAAMIRARSLNLGGGNDYYASSSAPGSSTLVAAAASATNVYILAYGEREGLAPGERLEVYGDTVRLVRTLAYGCPRGVNLTSAYTGRLREEELDAITEQLNALKPFEKDMGKLIALHVPPVVSEADYAKDSAAAAAAAVGAATSAADLPSPRRSQWWTLRTPEIQNSRILQRVLPGEPWSLRGKALHAQLEKMRRSGEEVVVAEWHSRQSPAEATGAAEAAGPELVSPDAAAAAPARLNGTSSASPGNANPGTATNVGSLAASSDTENYNPDAAQVTNPNTDALLMENGVCFRNADCCGLRALRTARFCFISSLERTANGLARRQRRLSGEETRPLEVLDVSAIDFTFAQAALQSTLELGLHTGEACRITHVPLTDAAAQRVETQTASYIRVVSSGPGRALARPFGVLPTHSFDVGAYTAYMPLPLGPLTKLEAAGICANAESEETDSSSNNSSNGNAKASSSASTPVTDVRLTDPAGVGGTKTERHQLAIQLAQAMATLRRGACMLVTFVPTPASGAALYYEMETQHHAEVLMERRVVANAKACIAEAISRTKRWGYITDEVLPAVDSAQGSSFSLMVVLE